MILGINGRHSLPERQGETGERKGRERAERAEREGREGGERARENAVPYTFCCHYLQCFSVYTTYIDIYII